MTRWLIPFVAVVFLLPDAPKASPILDYRGSARSLGMGDAGGAVTDPFVGSFNPGGLGVYMLEAHAGILWSQHDMSLDRRGENTLVVLGAPFYGLNDGCCSPRLSLGLAYHEQEFGIGNVEFDDGTSADFVDNADYFTVAAGVDYGFQVGAGVTFTSVRKTWFEANPEGNGHDYGVYLRLPLVRVLPLIRVWESELRFGSVTPELTTTWSYAWVNRGEYDSPFINEPFRQHDRLARSFAVGLRYEDATFVRYLWTRDDLIKRRFIEDSRHQGWEFDLLGIFQVRNGSWWTGSPSDATDTEGFTFQLQGLTRWLDVLLDQMGESRLPWFVRSLDVRYTTASFDSLGPADIDEFAIIFDFGPVFYR